MSTDSAHLSRSLRSGARASTAAGPKGRRRYRVYGLVIDSELPLTSVDQALDSDGEAAITLVEGTPDQFGALAPRNVPATHEWVKHVILGDGSVYMKADHVFETVIASDGRSALYRPLGSVDRRSLEANLLNFVVSASLTLQGEETLHSTVLEIDGRAVGLLGRSGAGKSTLGAYLVSRGADLVTDDMLRLKVGSHAPSAYCGPYRLKLLDPPGKGFLPEAVADGHFNALSGKLMVQPRKTPPFRPAPVPLAALFHLAPPDDLHGADGIVCTRLNGLELAKVIMSCAMDFLNNRPERLARQIEFAGEVAKALPVYELHYPRTLEIMDPVAQEIRRAIAL